MLTDREVELLNKICKVSTVKQAAVEMKISPDTANVMLYRIRKKNTKWRKGVNQVLGFRKRNKLLNKLLRDTMDQEALDELYRGERTSGGTS